MIEEKEVTSRANPSTGKKLFISYSRKDIKSADRIVKKLEDEGFQVWIDREDISAGQTWRVQIVQAIDECDAFLLLLSPNSAISDNVRKEIDLAQDADRSIFILTLQPVKLPADIRYQLTGLQQIDVDKLGINEAIKRMADSLHKKFARIKSVPPAEKRLAEIIIQGIDLSKFTSNKQELLLEFLANLSETNRSNLQIVKVGSGSVRVTIDMPALAAIRLKTLALNQDERLQQYAISALKLSGNKNFIQVQTGTLTPSGRGGGRTPLGTTGGSAMISLFLISIVAVIAFLTTLAVIFTVQEASSTPALTEEPLTPFISVSGGDDSIIAPGSRVVEQEQATEIFEAQQYCSVAANFAYFRQGPSTQYNSSRYRYLPHGEELLIVARDETNTWFLFQTEDGTEGWLYEGWVDCQFDTTIIPVASEIPPLPQPPPRKDKPKSP